MLLNKILRFFESTESVFLDLTEEMAEEEHAKLFGNHN
jgi:hypothetical protein